MAETPLIMGVSAVFVFVEAYVLIHFYLFIVVFEHFCQ